MTEHEMFEASFKRPTDYFKRCQESQWNIDSDLGILDWKGSGLSGEDMIRFHAHYEE